MLSSSLCSSTLLNILGTPSADSLQLVFLLYRETENSRWSFMNTSQRWEIISLNCWLCFITWYAVGLHCCKDMLLILVQVVIHWDSPILSCKTALWPGDTHFVLSHEITPSTKKNTVQKYKTSHKSTKLYICFTSRSFCHSISQLLDTPMNVSPNLLSFVKQGYSLSLI